jgi:hypothetical protein
MTTSTPRGYRRTRLPPHASNISVFSFWSDPRVRERWQPVALAALMAFLGVASLIAGIVAAVMPIDGRFLSQSQHLMFQAFLDTSSSSLAVRSQSQASTCWSSCIELTSATTAIGSSPFRVVLVSRIHKSISYCLSLGRLQTTGTTLVSSACSGRKVTLITGIVKKAHKQL